MSFGSYDESSSQSTPTVPVSIAGSGAINPVQGLDQIFNQNQESLQELAKRASIPIAGPHAMALPSAMTRPVQPYQETPLDHRPVVGAGNAKGQGITNSIIAATNFIGKVATAEKQHKQDQVTDAATKLFTSQQAIDEAQSTYDQAKATGNTQAMEQAKSILDQNTKARDGIMADPKMRKALTKGLNINYTDPSSNDSDEHKAVQVAMKNAKSLAEKKQIMQAEQAKQNQAAGAAAGQAFAAQQPRTMVPNQQAISNYQAAMQQRKDQLETLKAMGPVYAAQITQQGRVDVENLKQAGELRKAHQEGLDRLAETQTRMKQDDKNNQAAERLASLKNSMERSLEAMKQGNPIEVLKLFNSSSKDYETALTETQKSRQALNNELDKNPGSSRSAEIRNQLLQLDAADSSAKNAFLMNRNFIAKGLNLPVTDERLQIPTVHVGDGVTNATGTGTESATNNGPSLDPRTGKPWSSAVSAADRALISTHYEAGVIKHNAEQTVDQINTGVRKLGRFFSGESGGPD